MRKRSNLLIFASLLVFFGCVDTAEPTGPVPTPPEDGGGELAPPTVSDDGDTQASAAQRRAGSTQRN
jgi:hypothetical protein